MSNDRDDEFRDDYMWDVEHGFIGEAERLLQEDEDDEISLDLDGFEISEIEDAGVDIDEFELMDYDERREALIEAGLDPDEFDYL